jgi:hypothetical protein
MSSICAGTAADIEDAANALHVVVGGNGNKFPFGKRRHPEAVNQGLARDQIQGTHVPHLKLVATLEEQRDMLLPGGKTQGSKFD